MAKKEMLADDVDRLLKELPEMIKQLQEEIRDESPSCDIGKQIIEYNIEAIKTLTDTLQYIEFLNDRYSAVVQGQAIMRDEIRDLNFPIPENEMVIRLTYDDEANKIVWSSNDAFGNKRANKDYPSYIATMFVAAVAEWVKTVLAHRE